jgi:nicotinamidase-related amidase
MTREFTEDEVLALARRAYQHGTAEFQLAPDRAALLVIDMQDEFVRPGWTPYWIPQATRQVPRLARLLATCRARGVPCCTLPLPPPTTAWTGRPAVPPCPAATRSLARATRPGSATGASDTS